MNKCFITQAIIPIISRDAKTSYGIGNGISPKMVFPPNFFFFTEQAVCAHCNKKLFRLYKKKCKNSSGDPHKHIATDLWQRSKGNTVEQRQSFPQMVLEQLTDHLHAKNEFRHRPYALHKNQLRIHHRPKCKTQNYNTPRR